MSSALKHSYIAVNPLVCFRKSAIHGTGGFARTDIAAGARVVEYRGERITKNESLRHCLDGNPFIFALDEVWDLDGSVTWNQARYLNHSCEPNCEAERIDDRIWIVARRNIRAGEELTFNYGYGLEDYREHECRCGAAGCVGYMVSPEFFDHVKWQNGLAPM
ncbi:MAG TPA: SET domain-containing protein-lysine N-methyltransferase [Candidatus Acidoferrum sp.]|nr:SET domain-containing protein-lysine N-methyltransferase [Candidatus Acidoferrum sp.]